MILQAKNKRANKKERAKNIKSTPNYMYKQGTDEYLLNHTQQWLNYKKGMQMNLWTVVSRGQSQVAADSSSPLSKSCSTFQHCASASLSEKTFS